MYARLSHFRWPATNTAEGVPVARELILPAFRQAPGFCGLDALVDRVTGEAVGISWWATESHAAAAGADTALAAALANFPAVGFSFGARRAISALRR